MIQPDGTGSCDVCGHTEQNDSILHFAKLIDLDGITPLTLLFCRDNGHDLKLRQATGLQQYVKTNGELPTPADSTGLLTVPDPEEPDDPAAGAEPEPAGAGPAGADPDPA